MRKCEQRMNPNEILSALQGTRIFMWYSIPIQWDINTNARMLVCTHFNGMIYSTEGMKSGNEFHCKLLLLKAFIVSADEED